MNRKPARKWWSLSPKWWGGLYLLAIPGFALAFGTVQHSFYFTPQSIKGDVELHKCNLLAALSDTLLNPRGRLSAPSSATAGPS